MCIGQCDAVDMERVLHQLVSSSGGKITLGAGKRLCAEMREHVASEVAALVASVLAELAHKRRAIVFVHVRFEADRVLGAVTARRALGALVALPVKRVGASERNARFNQSVGKCTPDRWWLMAIFGAVGGGRTQQLASI